MCFATRIRADSFTDIHKLEEKESDSFGVVLVSILTKGSFALLVSFCFIVLSASAQNAGPGAPVGLRNHSPAVRAKGIASHPQAVAADPSIPLQLCQPTAGTCTIAKKISALPFMNSQKRNYYEHDPKWLLYVACCNGTASARNVSDSPAAGGF